MTPEEIKELKDELRIANSLIAKLTDQCRELEAHKGRPELTVAEVEPVLKKHFNVRTGVLDFMAFAKEILDLFDEEEIRKDERVKIGLQIQQQWSKDTSAKDYSPYRLVDFLGAIITKLNKGQSLEEKT